MWASKAAQNIVPCLRSGIQFEKCSVISARGISLNPRCSGRSLKRVTGVLYRDREDEVGFLGLTPASSSDSEGQERGVDGQQPTWKFLGAVGAAVAFVGK